MTKLTPLETLFDEAEGIELFLPEELNRLYGCLRIPTNSKRPYVISNFVTTLDGVVSLGEAGKSGGGEISGFNPHDRMLMGLLRAAADAVIVGAGTLRAAPKHLWTAQHIYPLLEKSYKAFRQNLNKPATPLNVIVTASGHLDCDLPVLQSKEISTLVVTTAHGEKHLRSQQMPSSTKIVSKGSASEISAQAILEAVAEETEVRLVLVEGGPALIGDFFAERCLDELFLTLAPQIAGRDDGVERPGLVSHHIFAPEQSLWGRLRSVRRAESHLFLRYAFDEETAHKSRDIW